jgi:leucyl aminopeptidase
MSTQQIRFHAVGVDESPEHRLVTLFKDPDSNEEHLKTAVGDELAQRIIDLMHNRLISGNFKEFNMLPTPDGAGWVLLLGIGHKADLETEDVRDDRIRSVVAIAARFFRKKSVLSFGVGDFSETGVSAARVGMLIGEGAGLGTYRYDVYKTQPNPPQTESVSIITDHPADVIEAGASRGGDLAESVCMARNLINCPSSDLRPMDFASIAREISRSHGHVEIEILGRDELAAEGMGLHLGVARGSDSEPCVCVLRYCPPSAKGARWDLGLVGKGVTFDSGGYDMKSSAGMRRMYRDMAGAGAVLGAFDAIAQRALPIRVVAVIPLAENMVSGDAFRPGDILTARNGTTVEIANTDAEGRLLLGDALDYICDIYQPRTLVDIATLTGAVRSALGVLATGLITAAGDAAASDAFATELQQLGRHTGEWVWRLPGDDAYGALLSSKAADMANCSTDRSAGAGTITAALFLKHFIKFDKIDRWAHLDIAATSFMERPIVYNRSPYNSKTGATGVGVRLLTELAQTIADDT